MKMAELRDKDTGSLQSMEKELTENLFAVRLQKRSGQLENTAKLSLTKRELAQVKTVLRARELGLEVIETHPDAKGEKKSKPAAKQAKPAHKPAAKKHAAAKSKGKPAKAKAKAPAPKAKSKSAAKSSAKPGKSPKSKKK